MQKVFCNKCGKELDRYEEWDSIETVMPYGSKYDGSLIDLDLCTQCLDELIDSCKISPVRPDDDDDYDE